MANVKISNLTAATTPVAGTEVLPIVQSGATVKVSIANLTAGRSVSATGLALAGSTSGTVTLTAKAVAGSSTFRLPSADGTSGQAMVTDGSGNLSFATASASQWTTSGSNIYYASGNVGINTSSTPDAFLQVYAAAGKAATFGNNVNNNGNYIVLGGTLSTKNWVLANNMIVGGEFGIGRTSATGGTTIGSAYDLMIDSNGGVKVANTLGVGYTNPSTSGAGITFPATQSASTDANTLDDYEEGTWTPALSTTSGSISFSSVSGTYTKIGRLVYVRASLSGTATISSPTGDLKLTSLPFTIGSPEVGAGSTTPYNFTAGAYSINLETIGNTTTAYIFNFANGTRSSAHSYFQAGCFINLSMCYQI
jgi:hypothetical protein